MADSLILSKEALKQQLKAMNLPISGNKDKLLERYRSALANMKKNGSGNAGAPLFVIRSDDNPAVDLNLPTYDLRDNVLLCPSRREGAMKDKVREAVEAQFSNFSGLEMPIEAKLAIELFVNRILDGVLNNFQNCSEEGMRDDVKPLQVENQKLKREIKILRDSHEAILKKLSLLENTPQRLRVPPNETPSTAPSVPSTQQPTNTPTPVVPKVQRLQPATTTFASVAARKSQPPKNSEVRGKVRSFNMKGTKQADEKTLTANPLQARGPTSRDFAIRGIPRHVTAEQLYAYLHGIGEKPRFVRIVPIGPDDTKSSTVGRIGIYASDVDRILKAENWSSNISIAPWKQCYFTTTVKFIENPAAMLSLRLQRPALKLNPGLALAGV